MQTGDTDNLLDLAQRGDIAAGDSLMMRYRNRLRQVINVFLDPRLSARVDPSDVLQEALAQAANRLPQYLEERPIDFYYWLRAIVRDELTRVHRRHMLAAAIGPFAGKETGETALLRRLLSFFRIGDVVVADRYFCCYWLVATLMKLEWMFASAKLNGEPLR